MYDEIWRKAYYEALRLRGLGYQPKQICSRIARTFFEHEKGKYNTVKLWYKRTFPGEWDTADKNGDVKENQQPICHPGLQQPTEISYQQQAGNPLQITQAFFYPQHQQDDFRSQQHNCGGHESASIVNTRHLQGSHQNQPNGEASQLHHEAIFSPPYQNGIHQCQAGNYDPLAHIRFYHDTFNQVGPIPHRALSHRASDPVTQHDDSKHQSNHYIINLPTGAVDLSDQHDSLHYQECSSFQELPAKANDRGCQTSPISLPQSGNSSSQDSHQSRSVFEENSLNDNWLLEDFLGLSKSPVNLDIPVDDQQLNIQDNAAVWHTKPTSQHRRPNPPQHANCQSVTHSSADRLSMSPGNGQSYSAPNPQHLKGSFEGQHGTLQSAAESYRSNSIFDNPVPDPRSQPPPRPVSAFILLHDDNRLPSWKFDGKTMVEIDNTEFPSRPPKEPVKSRKKRKFRASISPSREKLNVRYIPTESLAQAKQSGPARNSTAKFYSSHWDSGYFSVNSALSSKLLLSLSSLNLTDDPNLKTDYKDVGSGFVEVEATWRMKQTDLEKLSDSIVDGTGSKILAALSPTSGTG